MKEVRFLLVCMLALLLGAAPVALGHWDESMPYKWLQYPDLSDLGMDVDATAEGYWPPQVLADDFLCTTTGWITGIHIWGSWWHDAGDPMGVVFTLSIHRDIPAHQSPTGYSMPGEVVWWREFYAGEFEAELYYQAPEGYYVPCVFPPYFEFPGDTMCWLYNFWLPEGELWQEGTADEPVIYWLDVQAQPVSADPMIRFGWKTSLDRWNDAAVWVEGSEPVPPEFWWNMLIYPEEHPYAWQPIDLAFVITGEAQVDWGDAPDYWPMGAGYPTLAGNNGASHVIGGPWLGDPTDAPDPEPDGQPDPVALGDDQDLLYPPPNDDEDGVSIPILVVGRTDTISFEVNGAAGGGVVQIWIDWNANMSWLDAGEMVYNMWQPNGVQSFSVTPPAGSSIGQTFLRARISTNGGLPPDGPASDGEVEDHEVWIEQGPEELDFGDAPDPTYPTWLVSNGARHFIGGPHFCDAAGGDAPDPEPDGQPDPMATGDDLDGNDDEDGVSIPVLVQGQMGNISLYVCGAGANGAWVQIWIDWDGSGSWEAAEQVFNGNLPNGPHIVPVTPPGTSVVGMTFARCRISTGGGLRVEGLASDGEVEDHEVWIEQVPEELDFGDAPDPTYQTLVANDGARHVISSLIFLGNGVDAEPDGQPEPAAMGDDMNIFYPGIPWPPGDEDGVFFTSPLMPGSWATVDVWVSAAGYLNAWLDFNGNGSWMEGIDQIFTDVWLDPTINPNPQTLWFWVPFGAQPGPTFARFRFSTQRQLSYVGQAQDGEVEDYEVFIEENPAIKWIQLPDTSPNGVDIKVNSPDLLADDFECKSYGPITDVHLWGSWKYDEAGQISRLHLSFHTDDPVGTGGSDPCNTYSKPDELRWERDFWPGEFDMVAVAYVPDGEFWWDPLQGTLIPSGDWTIWRIDVYIDPCDAFVQDGDPCHPVTYWLDVQVDTDTGEFGWKTRRFPEHYMDDAVIMSGVPIFWEELRYPERHPYEGKSIDMAFVLTGEEWPRPKPPTPHLKWSQPPIEWDPTQVLPVYCGWDEKSYNREPSGTEPCDVWKIVADDFRCLGSMPIDSIHWWGSYYDFEWSWGSGQLPPELPIGYKIGFWSNVPAGAVTDYSYPELLLWQVDVDASRVKMEEVGMDDYMGYPSDVCFQFYVDLEPYEVFWQKRYLQMTRDDTFWLSIVAVYPGAPADPPYYPFGMKTRPWPWMDDAVTFRLPDKPEPGMVLDPLAVQPLIDPVFQQSVDVSFELDTDPNYIKFEQPFTGIRHWAHYEDIESMAYEDASGALNIVRMAADDWPCEQKTPVTAIVWWGSYLGYYYKPCEPMTIPPPVKPDYFLLRIWDDVPAGADTTYSHPGKTIWEYRTSDYDEVLVGYDKDPRLVIGPPREPVFRYSVRLPRTAWFRQKDVNDIYWLSVTAVYKAGHDPMYNWGWTNHEYKTKDAAVIGYLDVGGPVPVWRWDPIWSDQARDYVDLSFVLFTEPGCFPCAHPDYFQWLDVGKPDCWCYPRQCHGDADGLPYGKNNYWVAIPDLTILKNAWNKPLGLLVGNEICADFDHLPYGKNNYRVAIPDLTILKANWNIPNGPDPNCFAGY